MGVGLFTVCRLQLNKPNEPKEHNRRGVVSCSSTLWIEEHEMNNPLAFCELATRAPNISAGHMIKQA